MPKLHEIEAASKLRLNTDRAEGETATFHHIDGAYSYITLDSDGMAVHLSATTPMKLVDGHYEIDYDE